MTLKARLATMMVGVLVAVLGLQFFLLERDRRILESRLEEMSRGLDRTTAVFVEHAREVAEGRESRLDAVLADVLVETRGSPADLRLFVWADTTVTSDMDTLLAFIESDEIGAGALPRLLPPPRHHFVGDSLQVTHTVVVDTLPAGTRVDASWRAEPQTQPWLATEEEKIRAFTQQWSSDGHRVIVRTEKWTADPSDTLAHAGRRIVPPATVARVRRSPAPDLDSGRVEMVLNLPLLSSPSDSFYSVEMRYPLDQVTEELAASRRRAIVWMSAILGVGILGAVVAAGRFTRPIRTLQRSFGRVVDGELDLELRRERSDEIGHLTDSFNNMVRRLKESKEMEARLGEAERLATVGRLAAGVAHEVRNPLNAILLTMQQMRSRNDAGHDPVAFERYYGLVTGELARLERLVSSFLDLASSGQVEPARVDVAASLASTLELFRPEAESRGIELTSRIEGPVWIEADLTRLPMIWNNLVANAIAAVADGGRITVRARKLGEGANAEPGHDQRTARVEVVVEDDGPGFDESQLSRIWEPFFSQRAGGTGLGLSIVRAVVEHHGGAVEAGNGQRGAWVRVELPVRFAAGAVTTGRQKEYEA